MLPNGRLKRSFRKEAYSPFLGCIDQANGKVGTLSHKYRYGSTPDNIEFLRQRSCAYLFKVALHYSIIPVHGTYLLISLINAI